MKRITSMLVCLLLFGVSAIFAQDVQIRGTVTSAEDGSPLPGVYVRINGTNTGAATDVNGNYQLSVSRDATLVFSSVGMKTVEIPVGGQSVINVVMEVEAVEMAEVVVTALGISREEKSLGYSVTEIQSEDAVSKTEPDLIRGLQGKVPGVDIRSSLGAPGAATRITIRGTNTFVGTNQPLIVVDGIPYFSDQIETTSQSYGNGGAYASAFSTIDPNDIASITVLKGASAAALYGSRAANGVIYITTKSGEAGASRKGFEVTFTTSNAWEKVAEFPEYQNTYGNGANFIYSNANGSWGPRFDSRETIPVWPAYLNAYPDLFPANGEIPFEAQPDNVESLFNTGFLTENSLNFAGGSDNASFNATVSMLNQDGTIPYSEYDRYSVSVGGNTRLANGLTVGGTLAYTRSDQVGGFFGENQFNDAASSFARTLFLGRTWDMSLPYETADGLPISTNPAQYDHPLWSLKHNKIDTQTDRIVSTLNLNYKLFDWLSFSYKLGVNNYKMFRRQTTDIGSRSANGLGRIVEDTYEHRELESTLLATLTRSFSDFDLELNIGNNVNQRSEYRQGYQGDKFKVPGIYDIDNTKEVVPIGGGISKRRLVGIMGDMTIGYQDWAYVTFTGRNDWTSTLAPGNNSYFYYGINGSFVFTDALGISSNALSFGKIRLGYAQVGNDAPPYSLYNVFVLGDPFEGNATISASSTGYSSALKPEKTKEFEIGTNLRFINGRIDLDFTWYNKNSTDLITDPEVPDASGFNAVYTNLGKINNKGIEIGLNLVPVQLSTGLRWEIYTTYTKNKNEVIELAPGVERFILNDLFLDDMTPVLIPGQAYGVFEGTQPLVDEASGAYVIDPQTGFIYLDQNNGIIGDPNPDYKMAITNTLTYKGLTLSVLWDMTKGGDIYSVTLNSLLGRGVTKDTEDREHSWIIPGYYGMDDGTMYRDASGSLIPNRTQVTTNDLYFYGGGPETTFAMNSAGYFSIFDATVYRLREIALSYQLPTSLVSKLGLGSLEIGVNGRNLWFFAPNVPKYTNMDPEINNFGSSNTQGVDLSGAPSVKRYGISLKVTF